MNAKQPSIAGSFHIIFGANAAGSVRLAGAKKVHFLNDPLCPGPCDQDPIRHLRKRKDYWITEWSAYEGPHARHLRGHAREWKKSFIGARSFARLVACEAKDRSVVLWTTPTFVDRLAFWWMLDALQYSNVEQKRCWVGDVNLPDLGPTPLGTISPRLLLEFFSNHIEPLSVIKRESMLWQKFVSPSPLAFDHARRTVPGLEQICEPYGMFFPQTGPRSSLRLSQLDQVLLDALAPRKWLRPIDLLKRNQRLVNDYFLFGDSLILQRLRAFAKHGQQPPLERRSEERATSAWNAVSYQLTPFGEQIRDHLPALSAAPPIFVGGCQLYADAAPWVRRNRGPSWWIQRLA